MFIIKNKISHRRRGTQRCRPVIPKLSELKHKNYGNKKDVGVCLSRAYPIAQALALPLLKDKQRQACPRQR